MSSIKKYGFVDETRGLAILMVILVHTTQQVHNLPSFLATFGYYGQTGVQLFFIASSFTMCNSFANRSSEPHSVKSFYLRRFFRIAPLYYFGLVLYLVINAISRDGFGCEPYTLFNVLANILFLHGFVPSANNSLVPGGWSIGTEMAFYAIFPIIYYWIISKGHGLLNRSLLALVLAIALNLVLQLVIIPLLNLRIENNNFFYFLLFNQLPVFLLGYIYYFAFWKSEQKLSKSVRLAIQIIGFFSFSMLAGLMLFVVKYPIAFTLLPLFSGISFVFLMDFLRTKSFSLVFLQNIGRVSFSMYIFHFIFVCNLVPFLFSIFPFEIDPRIKIFVAFMIGATLSFITGRISEKIIEENGIALGSKLIAKYVQNSGHKGNLTS